MSKHTPTLDRTNKVINTALAALKDLMEKTDSSVMQAYLCDIEFHLEVIREVHNQEINCHDELVEALKSALFVIKDIDTSSTLTIQIKQALQKAGQ